MQKAIMYIASQYPLTWVEKEKELNMLPVLNRKSYDGRKRRRNNLFIFAARSRRSN